MVYEVCDLVRVALIVLSNREKIVARPERPFLTARWTELVLLNFAVPTDVVARLAPPGTVADLFDGRAFVSIVGFRFHQVRLCGVAIPRHTRFEEVNLRFYVRRETCGEVRHGVAFAHEVAPRLCVAAVANWIYNEHYFTRPMKSEIRMAGEELAAGDTVEYRWREGRGASARWNRLGAQLADDPRVPPAGSFEEFIVEHYWGYGRTRDGGTLEYYVKHPPWRVAPVEDVVWDCDVAAVYENTPLAQYLTAPPASALVADGSPVELYRGRRVTADIEAKSQPMNRTSIRLKPGALAEPA